MGQGLTLTASDGFVLDAYRADPAGAPKGGLVVIQEIFGVNGHVRGVADGFAADGYAVIAPALFDRTKKGVELGYTPEDIERGRELRGQIDWDTPLLDITAAIQALDGCGKIGTVGYCWGGSVAWLTATRLDVAATVCYYGGQIGDFRDETASCPVMMHFGETDAGIPLETVEAVRAAQPGVELHLYPAGHGFNCEQRGDYSPESAALARERTLAFFAKHVG
jgi:carboxymethylenebutenolidase